MRKRSYDGDHSSEWQRWSSDGRLATIAWFFVFLAYIGFRLAKIDAPELTNTFVTITGIWVGNLGIAQSKKVSREVERHYEKLTKELKDELPHKGDEDDSNE